MSNIVINGETYEGIESISANTPDGGTATYLSETVLDTKQNKIDENLNTESKEIVGAINELKESFENGVKEYLHHVTYECYYENYDENLGIDEMVFISSGEFALRSNSATSLENYGELLKYDGYYFDYFYEEFQGGVEEQMPGRGLIFGHIRMNDIIRGRDTNNEQVNIWIGDEMELTDIVTEITVV